ncbi:glycosyltransferase [Actinomadura sp. 7K507]|uniref:glycosyltransferase n=1 Tax=Actinomadura sp. 7K507 TaxID=2530365 RepID=UPI001043D000|nr:glycosyltransferase [Actinomadura sp. 7K507]TDC97488.1 glycosyltransferase family 1 protein [Actinomadura sp. 7K507]
MRLSLIFDIRSNHDTGVSRYGLSLLRETAPIMAAMGWRLTVVAWKFQERRARRAAVPHGAEVLICPEPEGFVRASPWLRDLVRTTRPDLYYTTHYTADHLLPVPFVFTIHDLTRLKYPALSYTDGSFARRFGWQEFSKLKLELETLPNRFDTDGGDVFSRYFAGLNRVLVEQASLVTVVSHSTARDVRSLLDVPAHRLALVPGAVDPSVFHPTTAEAVQAVRTKYALTGPYVLYVGLANANKRFPWLVEQLLTGANELPAELRLVAVGGHAEALPEVGRLLADHGTGPLVFTGRVPDVELTALYTGASALVTASVNEGVGLPCLEAVACGTPVIAPDIIPLRESLAEAGLFYRPGDGSAFRTLVASVVHRTARNPATDFEPPRWHRSGRLLMAALQRAAAPDIAGPCVNDLLTGDQRAVR